MMMDKEVEKSEVTISIQSCSGAEMERPHSPPHRAAPVMCLRVVPEWGLTR